MTWAYVTTHQPFTGASLPEQGVEPLACHLNHVVAILDYRHSNGVTRSVELTAAMDRRARDLEMTPETYVAGLLAFADKAVA